MTILFVLSFVPFIGAIVAPVFAAGIAIWITSLIILITFTTLTKSIYGGQQIDVLGLIVRNNKHFEKMIDV